MTYRALAVTALFACALLAGNSAARAAVGVFVDDVPNSICTNGGEILIGDTTAPVALDLCVEIGPSHSNDACRPNSTGDDICAFHVGIELLGTGFVQNFQPSAGVRYWPQTFITDVRTIKFAYVGGNPQPNSAGPFKIGTLIVDATPLGGTRVLAVGYQAVDSGLQSRLVPPATLATLPEPGLVAQLASGVLALVLLRRVRRRPHEA